MAGGQVVFGGTILSGGGGGGGGGTTTNPLTMNNSGAGAASGATFDGSAAVTLSYNTIGAVPSGAAASLTPPVTISDTAGNVDLILQNTTAATSALSQPSPIESIAGRYWAGAASAPDSWTLQTVIANPSAAVANTNISESAGSVVTLSSTLSPKQGDSVYLTGLTVGVWLNGLTVTVITPGGVQFTFNDPTSHGTQGSAAETGTATNVSTVTALTLGHSGILGSGVSGTRRFDVSAADQLVLAPGAGFGTTNTNPALVFGTDVTTGIGGDGNGQNQLGFWVTGQVKMKLSGTGLVGLQSDGRLYWTAGTAASWADAIDTGFSRLSAASLALGNGAAGDFTGTLKCTVVNLNNGGNGGTLQFVDGNNSITVTNTHYMRFIAAGNSHLGVDPNGNALITSLIGFNNTNSLSANDTGISWLAAGSLAVGNGTAGDTTGNLSFNKVIKYAGVTTVGAGVPSLVAAIDLTAQGAAIAAGTALYAVPAAGAGLYRVTAYAKITTPGTTSILGGTNGFQLTWTDPTDSTTPTAVTFGDASSQPLNGNTTTTIYVTSATVACKASTNLQYGFDYTSTGTAMQFKISIKVEYLG